MFYGSVRLSSRDSGGFMSWRPDMAVCYKTLHRRGRSDVSFHCRVSTLMRLRGGILASFLLLKVVGVRATLVATSTCLAIANAVSSASDVYFPGMFVSMGPGGVLSFDLVQARFTMRRTSATGHHRVLTSRLALSNPELPKT